MPWKVFAEDAGTGLISQDDADYGDGAQFNALVHDQNSKDYAVVAPSLSTDSSVPNTTLSESTYRLTVQNVSERDHDGDGTTVTWPEVTFVVYAPQATLDLSENSINYIFITFDLTTTGDDAHYVVNTDGSEPSGPSLKVAEVNTDTGNEIVTNEDPTGYFNNLYLDGGVTSPDLWTNQIRTAGGSNINLQPVNSEQVQISRIDTVVDSTTDIVKFGGGTVDTNFLKSVRFQEYINFVNSSSIRDSGTDAISFDGSANVSIPNDLEVGSLTDGAGVTHSEELADASTVAPISNSHTASDGEIILADSSGGNISITLPSPTKGFRIVVKKTSDAGNIVSVETPGSSNIEGRQNLSMTAYRDAVTLVADGTDWWII